MHADCRQLFYFFCTTLLDVHVCVCVYVRATVNMCVGVHVCVGARVCVCTALCNCVQCAVCSVGMTDTRSNGSLYNRDIISCIEQTHPHP